MPPRIPDLELLRCVGEGSYGQVWLAWSRILDQWRAVKVVFKSKFAGDEREFKRELNGIRKYEPISRKHESLVQILHVGEDEAAGNFYYVMELADSVQGDAVPDPDSYEPRTLRSELKRRKRLPPAECINIGIALATGLEQLHKNELVHRDIKPANIIFVQGRPKLADIGLVTNLDGTFSFVGTEGYIAQEGPGKPPADIYALGMVLYEIATGESRLNYPNLPSLGGMEETEKTALLELNAIFLKACHKDSAQRHRNAGALRDELARLKLGKSIRAARWYDSMFQRAKAVFPWGLVGAALFALWQPWAGKRSDTRAESTSVMPELQFVDQLKVPGFEGRWHGALLGNWNGDQSPDFFLTKTGVWFVVSAKDGRTICGPNSPAPDSEVQVRLVAQVSKNSKDYAFVSWTVAGQPTNASLAAYEAGVDARPIERSAFNFNPPQSAETNGEGRPYTALTPFGMEVVSKSGLPEFLASAQAAYARRPRGIYAFSPFGSNAVWFHETAATPATIAIMDVDGDEAQDIICGSGAPDNGNRLQDGTDDSHSYIYALSREKQARLWHTDLGDLFTTSEPLLVRTNRNGDKALFAWVQSSAEARALSNLPPVGQIVRLDAANGSVVTNFDAGAQLTSCVAHDLDFKEGEEIITTDALGNIHVLDLNLNQLRSTNLVALLPQFTAVHLRLVGITNSNPYAPERIVLTSFIQEFISGDVTGSDRGKPVTNHTHNLTVHVLDTNLRSLATNLVSRLQTNGNLKALVADMDGDGTNEIVTLTDFESPRVLKFVE